MLLLSAGACHITTLVRSPKGNDLSTLVRFCLALNQSCCDAVSVHSFVAVSYPVLQTGVVLQLQKLGQTLIRENKPGKETEQTETHCHVGV